MGSSASSEPQVQPVQEDVGATGGVRMTVSSRIIDDANAFRGKGSPSSGRSSDQGAKGGESSRQPSDTPSSKPRTQTVAEAPTSTGKSAGTHGNYNNGGEYVPDSHLEALRERTSSTVISAPSEPVWNTPTADLVRSALVEPIERVASDEHPSLEQILQSLKNVAAFPEPAPFNVAAHLQAEPICQPQYAAVTDCIKAGNPYSCARLMDEFSACSAAYHVKQQAKATQPARKL